MLVSRSAIPLKGYKKVNTVDCINSFLEKAQNHANKHDFDDRLTFRHAAILASGSKVISKGFNYLHISSLRFDAYAASMARRLQNENHAETAAILRGRRKHDTRGMDVYVVRVNAKGELAQSRPCELCQHVMYSHGIQRCFYSISPNEFGVMKVQNPAEKFFRVVD